MDFDMVGNTGEENLKTGFLSAAERCSENSELETLHPEDVIKGRISSCKFTRSVLANISEEDCAFFSEMKQDRNPINLYGINRMKNYIWRMNSYLRNKYINNELLSVNNECNAYLEKDKIPEHCKSYFIRTFYYIYETYYAHPVEYIRKNDSKNKAQESSNIQQEMCYGTFDDIPYDFLEKELQVFEEKLLKQLQKAYSENIYSVTINATKEILKFNNIETLKIAQKYIRHTNLIYNKLLSVLIFHLAERKGRKCSNGADNFGKCIYDIVEKTYYHFIPSERFASFLKMHLKPKDKSSPKNIYVLLVKDDANSKQFIEKLKVARFFSCEFITFNRFIDDFLGEQYYNHFQEAFKRIEESSQRYKSFDINNVCTPINKKYSENVTYDMLCCFPYEDIIKDQGRTLSHYDDIYNNFVSKNNMKALFFNEDFANSFISAEWLFQHYMYDDCLDKTYVVASYLKSIEQLLMWIIEKTSTGKDISVLGRGGFVKTQVGSDDFYRATLGNLSQFLASHHNSDVYFPFIDRKSRNTISEILFDRIKKERNGYFHKDNIMKIDIVKSVREKTILLYFLLLGSIDVLKTA